MMNVITVRSRNPCFSGQCFAISIMILKRLRSSLVAILVLVDSVLQFEEGQVVDREQFCRNPCFSGQCFAMKTVLKQEKQKSESQSLF